MEFGLKRKYLQPFILAMFILVFMLGSISAFQSPAKETSPNFLPEKVVLSQEALISESYSNLFKISESVRSVLFKPDNTKGLELKPELTDRRLFGHFETALIIVMMFYVFYRLSRTRSDDPHVQYG